jgi:hypothetical protein
MYDTRNTATGLENTSCNPLRRVERANNWAETHGTPLYLTDFVSTAIILK